MYHSAPWFIFVSGYTFIWWNMCNLTASPVWETQLYFVSASLFQRKWTSREFDDRCSFTQDSWGFSGTWIVDILPCPQRSASKMGTEVFCLSGLKKHKLDTSGISCNKSYPGQPVYLKCLCLQSLENSGVHEINQPWLPSLALYQISRFPPTNSWKSLEFSHHEW